MLINHFASRAEVTFDGIDVEEDLSDDDARVDEHDRTEKRLDLVATQEFHNSLTSSAHKKPRNTTQLLSNLDYRKSALSVNAERMKWIKVQSF